MRALLLLLAAATAEAGESTVTLRFATIAPEGTAWAREVKAFTRDVETLTNGGLHTKWYMGAIAGDELTVLERIRRGQLDGLAGAHACDRLSPSLRVMHLLGLFRSHAEILFVLGKLQPIFDKELHDHGFIDLGMGGGFGETIFFAREPVRSLADLKRAKFWIWDLDEVPRVQLAAMGVPLVPMSVESAARAYDEKRTDGFIAIPSAALAYQWSAQAKYFTPLKGGFLPACLLVSTTAFDALPIEQQRALKQASATLVARFEELGRAQDQKLLDGLFQKQGLQRIEVTPSFVNEFSTAAAGTQGKLGTQLVSPELLKKVSTLLDEYRGAHR